MFNENCKHRYLDSVGKQVWRLASIVSVTSQSSTPNLPIFTNLTIDQLKIWRVLHKRPKRIINVLFSFLPDFQPTIIFIMSGILKSPTFLISHSTQLQATIKFIFLPFNRIFIFPNGNYFSKDFLLPNKNSLRQETKTPKPFSFQRKFFLLKI